MAISLEDNEPIVRLLESNVGTGYDRIDEEAGVIYGVRVINLESLNGRRYRESALREKAYLYEGAKVNLNHVRQKPGQIMDRSLDDFWGELRNVRWQEGFGTSEPGLVADLHFLKTHEKTPKLLEAARRFPDKFGLSHDASGEEIQTSAGREVVEIYEVHSVDLVANPATTKGLFESVDMTEAFCPTGKGGGKKNSCSPKGGSGKSKAESPAKKSGPLWGEKADGWVMGDGIPDTITHDGKSYEKVNGRTARAGGQQMAVFRSDDGSMLYGGFDDGLIRNASGANVSGVSVAGKKDSGAYQDKDGNTYNALPSDKKPAEKKPLKTTGGGKISPDSKEFNWGKKSYKLEKDGQFLKTFKAPDGSTITYNKQERGFYKNGIPLPALMGTNPSGVMSDYDHSGRGVPPIVYHDGRSYGERGTGKSLKTGEPMTMFEDDDGDRIWANKEGIFQNDNGKVLGGARVPSREIKNQLLVQESCGMKKIKDLSECAKCKSLQEMIMSDPALGEVSVEGVDAMDAAAQVDAAFRAALIAVIDGDMDTAQKLAKMKAIFKAKDAAQGVVGDVSGGMVPDDESESEDGAVEVDEAVEEEEMPEEDGSEGEEEPPMEEEGTMQESVKKTKLENELAEVKAQLAHEREEKKVVAMLQESKREPLPVRVKAVMALSDPKERKQLIESFPMIGAGKTRPAASPSVLQESVSGVGTYPATYESFKRALNT